SPKTVDPLPRSPTHNELFYSTPGASSLFVRSIDTRAGLTFGTEQTLPLRGLLALDRQGYRAYDITRDGQRVLVILAADETNPASVPRSRPIHIIVNWFTELCWLSAQKRDNRHRDNRDRQAIVPDALPANQAFEFCIMGLRILNDRVHLAVDQSELLGQCRSEIGWFCRLHGFGSRLHSLARQLYCKLHPIHRR